MTEAKSNEQPDECREAFERFLSERGISDFSRCTLIPDNYKDPLKNYAWSMWKGGWNARAPKREYVEVEILNGAAAIDPNAWKEEYSAKHFYPKNAKELFKKRREKSLRQAERCAKAWGLTLRDRGEINQIEGGES